jgi:hypothetical protein
MELKITFEKAEWNKSQYGNDKELVFVRFPNCSFRWLPTYRQINQIKEALDIAEKQWKEKKLSCK